MALKAFVESVLIDHEWRVRLTGKISHPWPTTTYDYKRHMFRSWYRIERNVELTLVRPWENSRKKLAPVKTADRIWKNLTATHASKGADQSNAMIVCVCLILTHSSWPKKKGERNRGWLQTRKHLFTPLPWQNSLRNIFLPHAGRRETVQNMPRWHRVWAGTWASYSPLSV